MTAVCRAIAKAGERTFTDFGDASPSSVGHNLVPHILRMASTRAKARALRDMTNIGITAVEELDLGEKENNPPPGRQHKTHDAPKEPVGGLGDDQPAPTRRQLQTINDLSQSLNIPVDTEKLNKKTAGDTTKLCWMKNIRETRGQWLGWWRAVGGLRPLANA